MTSDSRPSETARAGFRFGPFVLDAERMELRRDGAPLPLRRQELDLLLLLVRRRGRVVSRAELVRQVWGGAHVSAAALDTALHRLRGALGPGAAGLVQSVRGRGVRFEAPVVETRPPSDFVGRGAILGELEALLADAAGGRGRIALLQAEAGMGKTRIARRLLEIADGFRSLTAWCDGDGGAPPYWPWLQVSRPLSLRALGSDDRPPLETRGGHRSRLALFDAFARELVAAARSEPLLLVIEELQAADAASLALLEFLAPRIALAPVLLLATRRSEEGADASPAAEACGRLLTQPHVRSFALPPLESTDVYGLMVALRGEPPRPDEVALVLERSGGNPLVVRELAEAPLVTPTALPLGVQALLSARLGRLSAATRRALGFAALCGTRVVPAWLEAAMNPPPGAGWAEEAIGRGVLERDGSRMDGLAFRHPLLRDALAGEIAAEERARFHHALATRLESDHPEPSAEVQSLVAHHFAAAMPARRDVAGPLRHALRAAESAAQLLAFETVEAHARDALAWLEETPPGTERDAWALQALRLAGAAANALMAGGPDRAAREQQARSLAERVGDAHARQILGGQRAVAGLVLGRYADARAGLAAFEAGPLVELRSDACALRAALAAFAGDFPAADAAASPLDQAPRSPALTHHLGLDPVALALPLAAVAAWACGDEDRALVRLAAARQGSAPSEPHAHAYTLFFAALLHDLRREPAALLEAAEAIDPFCSQHRIATFLGSGLMFRSLAKLAAGDAGDHPWSMLAETMKRVADAPVTGGLRSYKLYTAARFAAAGGELGAALAHVGEARAAAEASGEGFALAEILRCEGELLASSGESAAARSRLQESVELAAQQGAPRFELRSQLALGRLGEVSRARLAELLAALGPALRGPERAEARALLAAQRASGRRAG